MIALILAEEGAHVVINDVMKEAADKLTLYGHLKRDPSLIRHLFPTNESLWGLAYLSRKPEGRKELESLTGRALTLPEGIVTAA